MKPTLFSLTLAALLMTPGISSAKDGPPRTFPGVKGKWVQTLVKPSTKGLKEVTRMTGVDTGLFIFKKGSSIRFIEPYADAGILKGSFYQRYKTYNSGAE